MTSECRQGLGRRPQACLAPSNLVGGAEPRRPKKPQSPVAATFVSTCANNTGRGPPPPLLPRGTRQRPGHIGAVHARMLALGMMDEATPAVLVAVQHALRVALCAAAGVGRFEDSAAFGCSTALTGRATCLLDIPCARARVEPIVRHECGAGHSGGVCRRSRSRRGSRACHAAATDDACHSRSGCRSRTKQSHGEEETCVPASTPRPRLSARTPSSPDACACLRVAQNFCSGSFA